MTLDWRREIAVVIAGHGDRGGEAPNRTLQGHRDAIHVSDEFLTVTAGVLKGEPSLELALEGAQRSGARRIAVYPFFMADGYFTRKVLPDRITAAGLADVCDVLPPLGLDADLPALILAGAIDAAQRAGYDASPSRLLLVGHGSKWDPASAAATRRAASAIAIASPFRDIATAFLEEPPFVADALAATREPTVVSGFFSGDGMHAGEDIPEAIRDAGSNAVYAGPIGGSPGVADLMRQAIRCRFSPRAA